MLRDREYVTLMRMYILHAATSRRCSNYIHGVGLLSLLITATVFGDTGFKMSKDRLSRFLCLGYPYIR